MSGGPDWFDHLSNALPVLQPFNAMRSPLSVRMQQPQQQLKEILRRIVRYVDKRLASLEA